MGSISKIPSGTFFRLGDPFLTRRVRTTYVFQFPREMDKVLRGELTPGTEILCPQFSGNMYGDFVWAEIYPLVHERVIEALTVNKIGGWSTYAVRIVDKKGKVISGYHGLSITGRCEATFCGEEYSEIVYEAGPSGIPMKYYKGLVFDTKAWDRSDLFMPTDRKVRHILATAAVKRLFDEKGVSNVELQDVSEFKLLATKQDHTVAEDCETRRG
jgi:hypothetical protein